MKSLACWLALSVLAIAENPYFAHKDDHPVVRDFSGKEWGDDLEFPAGQDSIPFRAKVTTQRLAQMTWGAIYKISLDTSSKRELGPYHLLVTDTEVLMLESTDIDREIRVVREMAKRPKFEKSDVWGLTKGPLKYREGMWTTEVKGQGVLSARNSWHENSGHFGRFELKKGVGLIAVAQGRGAMLEGYELEWTGSAKKKP